jgi:hypothetical protein
MIAVYVLPLLLAQSVAQQQASGDVSFSAVEIALVTALLGAVVGALARVFLLLLQAKDQQLADVRSDRDAWKLQAQRGADVADRVTTVAERRLT